MAGGGNGDRLAEQETIIRWGRDSELASIWTSDRRVKADIQSRGWSPALVTRRGDRENGWFFSIPLAALLWGVKKRTK